MICRRYGTQYSQTQNSLHFEVLEKSFFKFMHSGRLGSLGVKVQVADPYRLPYYGAFRAF